MEEAVVVVVADGKVKKIVMKKCFLLLSLFLLTPSIHATVLAQVEIAQNIRIGNTNTSKTELQALANNYLKKYRVLEYISALTLTVDNPNSSITVETGYTEYNG